MRTLLVERRCPTCGSGDLLERFHAPRPARSACPFARTTGMIPAVRA